MEFEYQAIDGLRRPRSGRISASTVGAAVGMLVQKGLEVYRIHEVGAGDPAGPGPATETWRRGGAPPSPTSARAVPPGPAHFTPTVGVPRPPSAQSTPTVGVSRDGRPAAQSTPTVGVSRDRRPAAQSTPTVGVSRDGPPAQSTPTEKVAPPPPPESPKRGDFSLAVPEELLTFAERAETRPEPARRVVANELEYDVPVVGRSPAARTDKRSRWRELLATIHHRTSGPDVNLEISVAFRELSLMVRAGMPIAQSLGILSESLDNPSLKRLFATALDEVVGGRYLSQGLKRTPGVLSPVALHLVEVGEESGQFHELLARIAELEEKQARLKMQLRSALTYPIIMFVMCIAILIVLPSLLFQSLFAMMSDLNVATPLPTKIMMWISAGMRNPLTWILMAAGAGLVFTRYQALMKDSAMRLRRDEVLLRLWGIGPCLRFMVTVSFAQTLETLYSAGVPILRALDISAAATDNLALQTAMREAREEVQAGEELHVALARARFFPPGFLQILAAGGQSGDVPGMLEFAAKMSQQEIENRIAAAIAAIEPAMLLVMGLMVGSMVIAVISPLLKVLEALTL